MNCRHYEEWTGGCDEMYRQELADYSKSLAGYEAEYKKVA